ncbi:MAG: hypothetical protein JSV16_01635, partial [Candidatus Hydrogenedentota bacterium]
CSGASILYSRITFLVRREKPMNARLVVAALIVSVLCIAASNGDAEEGFSFKDVCYERGPVKGYVYLIGQVQNKTGKACRSPNFRVEIYDRDNLLVTVDTLLIRNLPKGKTRSFKELIGCDADRIASISISFELCD